MFMKKSMDGYWKSFLFMCFIQSISSSYWILMKHKAMPKFQQFRRLFKFQIAKSKTSNVTITFNSNIFGCNDSKLIS